MTLTKRRLCGAVVGVLVLGAATAPLAAQTVSYVRDLTFTPGDVLSAVKAPVDPSDPLYDSTLPDTQWLFTLQHFQTFDPGTGIVSFPSSLPLNIKPTASGLMALTGVGTSAPILKLLGFRNALWVYDLGAPANVGPSAGVPVPLFEVHSMAAPNRSDLTAIADGGFYTIDHVNLTPHPDFPDLGPMATVTEILVFAFEGDEPEPGQFSFDTRYHAYAPNGFVYLLDYGNNRVQWLDPANGFAFVDEFPLEAGVTTANMQFAIGATGNIYLGDGLGGGSTYDADGDYLGSFTLPSSVTGAAFDGVPHVSAGQHGTVFVFDDTGFHQYIDASVVEVTPPGVFGKSSPANGTVQPFDLVLSWTASSDATGYDYCLDTSHDGACNTSWVPVGAATSVAVTGLPAGTWHSWQVRANNASGVTYADGGATDFWSFGTDGVFGKSSPAHGAAAQSIDPVLSWAASGGATSYEYCLDTSHDGACNGSWVPVGLATSVAVPGLPAGTSHSWQVRANNAGGVTYADDGVTAFWRFTTGGMPTAPPVSYVRELAFLPAHNFPLSEVLPAVKAPVDTSDPLYDSTLPDTQWIFFTGIILPFDPGTGIVSPFLSYSILIKVDQHSMMALTGVGTSAPVMKLLGFRNEIGAYIPGVSEFVGPRSTVPLAVVQSMAAPNRTDLTAIADGGFYTIDHLNPTPHPDPKSIVTKILDFADDGDDPEPGQFSSETRYHAYAPNGYVYLLDYGNSRVRWLDPANGFAFAGEFPFQPGVPVANMQFAIGPTGHIYLGDGFGGGSTYDTLGNYRGNFTLPSPVTDSNFHPGGTPHLSSDHSGHVYVFDTTGFHQYLVIADDVMEFKDSFEDLP